ANIMADIAKQEGNYYKDYAAFYRLNRGQLYDQGMPQQSDFSGTQPNITDYMDDNGEIDFVAYGAANVQWRQSIAGAQNEWANDNPGAMQDYNATIRRATEETALEGE